jgi:mercuric ion transport protein
MADNPSASPTPRRPFPGAELLTLGGLAAAFGLAACCALPLLLGTLGLSAAWLTGVALLAIPHRGLLMAIGAAYLLGGAALLWRQQRAAAACDPDRPCAPAWMRAATLVGLLAGGALLWAGYAYA